MSWLGNIGKKIGDKISETAVSRVAAVVGAGVLALLGAGWGYLWHHVNPQFSYIAKPSSVSSHFISLAQIFNQIEKDSHQYCTGGWDQRLGKLGLRECYHFTFSPSSVYKTTVCAHDDRAAQVNTSDQLIATRYFERRFAPLECFRIIQRGASSEYEIVRGKDAQPGTIQFPNDAPQEVTFCGCSDTEKKEIATTIGASLQ